MSSPRLRSVALFCVAAFLLGTPILPGQSMTVFLLPAPTAGPSAITAGPDGNLWFTESGSNHIARMTPAGEITEFALPFGGSPRDITTGPDGNLWFTNGDPPRIARITPAGEITEYRLPDGYSRVAGITARPDGLWFGNASSLGDKIGRISVTGEIVEFPICGGSSCGRVVDVISGPDGNIWFALFDGRRIGRMTPGGAVTLFPIPSAGKPVDLTVGPDGNIWFTENLTGIITSGRLGRITTAGVISEFGFEAPNLSSYKIAVGPDQHLWFTEQIISIDLGPNRIGRLSLSGEYTNFPVASGQVPGDITWGPDGNLWLTALPGSIVRLDLGSDAKVPRMRVLLNSRRRL